jgi:hypothetical protein
MTVSLGALSEPQRQSWLGLLQVAADFGDGWCLVGGQMVHLLCVERAFTPVRPTDDSDVVLDVRARPQVLREFTQALVHAGFSPGGETQEGHQHRWVRQRASIDVLIPQGLGRAASRTGVTGGTTLATPGAQQAITRSEIVTVQVDDTTGAVRRPNMVGALVAKAAAFSVPNDSAKERHLTDFAVLAAIAGRSDRIAEQLTVRDRAYLMPMLSAVAKSRSLWASIQGADRGLRALTALTASAAGGPSAHDEPGVPPNPPLLDL